MYKKEKTDYNDLLDKASELRNGMNSEERSRTILQAHAAYHEKEIKIDSNAKQTYQDVFESINRINEGFASGADEIDFMKLATAIYGRYGNAKDDFHSDGFFFYSRASRPPEPENNNIAVQVECKSLMNNGFLHNMLESLIIDEEMSDVVICFAARLLFFRFFGNIHAPGMQVGDMFDMDIKDFFNPVIESKDNSVGTFDKCVATILLLIMNRMNVKNPHTGDVSILKEDDEEKRKTFFKEKNHPNRQTMIAHLMMHIMKINGEIEKGHSAEKIREIVFKIGKRYWEFDAIGGDNDIDSMLKEMKIS